MHHRTIRNRFRGYNFEDMNRRARGIKEERRGESFLVLRGTCAKSFERFAGKRKRDREEKRDVEG